VARCGSSTPVAVEPAGRRVSDIAHRMDRACGNGYLLADPRPHQPPFDFEFHSPLKDDHELVRWMAEVLPTLSRRVNPEVAAKPPGFPSLGD